MEGLFDYLNSMRFGGGSLMGFCRCRCYTNDSKLTARIIDNYPGCCCVLNLPGRPEGGVLDSHTSSSAFS